MAVQNNTHTQRSARNIRLRRHAHDTIDNQQKNRVLPAHKLTNWQRFLYKWYLVCKLFFVKYVKPLFATTKVKILAVLVVLIITPFLFMHNSAIITVMPLVSNMDYTDLVLIAGRDDSSSSDIHIMQDDFKVSESRLVTPEEESNVKAFATGLIRIHNSITTDTVRLIAGTRFKNSDGLIYKISKEVTVPGKVGNKPGTLDTTVTAEKVGNNYNISAEKLTIPGLKKYPSMYRGIYAQVKTNISGGSDGMHSTVSQDTKRRVTLELREQITKKIYERINEYIKSESVYFKSGIIIEFGNLIEEGVGGKIELTESASVSLAYFNKSEFAKALSKNNNDDMHGKYPTVYKYDDLDVIVNKQDMKDKQRNTVRVVINGQADIVWKPDVDRLKAELSGKDKKLTEALLERFPEVVDAKIVSKPFWRSKFPKDTTSIDVNILDVFAKEF